MLTVVVDKELNPHTDHIGPELVLVKSNKHVEMFVIERNLFHPRFLEIRRKGSHPVIPGLDGMFMDKKSALEALARWEERTPPSVKAVRNARAEARQKEKADGSNTNDHGSPEGAAD